MPADFDDRGDMAGGGKDFDTEPPFPTTVRIAGIVWIVFGCLIILNGFVNMAVTAAAPPPAKGASAGPPNLCGVVFALAIGAAFVFVGQQTVKGTAKDTLGNAIGSIVLALLQFGCGVVAIVGGLGLAASPELAQQAPSAGVLAIMGGVNIVAGIGLMAAGALALMGRSDYRVWRQWQKHISRA